jgi:hypothetical protein
MTAHAMSFGNPKSDRGRERDSGDGGSHQQFAGHWCLPLRLRDPISPFLIWTQIPHATVTAIPTTKTHALGLYY